MSKFCWECGKADSGFHFNLYGHEYTSYIDAINQPSDKKHMAFYKKDIYQREYCEQCFTRLSAERQEEKEQYAFIRRKIMFDKAVSTLERQDIDIYDYKKAIDAVTSYFSKNPTKFNSSHEITAAIILVYEEIHAKVQRTIGKYKVDFLIPELKVVLEIDGYMHSHRKKEDGYRDIELRQELGFDWEVVRIPTKYLEENAKRLVDAILILKKEMQKIRRENGGILPEWFTKRSQLKAK